MYVGVPSLSNLAVMRDANRRFSSGRPARIINSSLRISCVPKRVAYTAMPLSSHDTEGVGKVSDVTWWIGGGVLRLSFSFIFYYYNVYKRHKAITEKVNLQIRGVSEGIVSHRAHRVHRELENIWISVHSVHSVWNKKENAVWKSTIPSPFFVKNTEERQETRWVCRFYLTLQKF